MTKPPNARARRDRTVPKRPRTWANFKPLRPADAPPTPASVPTTRPDSWCVTHREAIVGADPAHEHCIQRRLRLSDLPEQRPAHLWCVDCAARVRAENPLHHNHILRPLERAEAATPVVEEKHEPPPIGRTDTGIAGFDEVVGGGIQDDQVILLAGQEGVGKTSLLLQIVASYVAQDRGVVYASGEQNGETLRALFGEQNPGLTMQSGRAHFVHTKNLDDVREAVNKHRPALTILDSVKTFADPAHPSRPGTLAQINRVTDWAMELGHAKRGDPSGPAQSPVIVVGHFTSDDEVAGGRYLLHMVDTVTRFRRGENESQRYLVSGKNRYGKEGLEAIFEFRGKRLVEVLDIARRRIEELGDQVGVTGFLSVAGAKARVDVVEALVTAPEGSSPVGDVRCEGIADKKLRDLLADLVQWSGISNWNERLVRVRAPSSPDAILAVALALLGSARNARLSPRLPLAFGTVSLTGKIQSVERMDERIAQGFRAGARVILGPPGVAIPPEVVRVESTALALPPPEQPAYVALRTLAELDRWVLARAGLVDAPPPPPSTSPATVPDTTIRAATAHSSGDASPEPLDGPQNAL